MWTKLDTAIAWLLSLFLLAFIILVSFKVGRNNGKHEAINHLMVDQVVHEQDQYVVIFEYEGNTYMHTCWDR